MLHRILICDIYGYILAFMNKLGNWSTSEYGYVHLMLVFLTFQKYLILLQSEMAMNYHLSQLVWQWPLHGNLFYQNWAFLCWKLALEIDSVVRLILLIDSLMFVQIFHLSKES